MEAKESETRWRVEVQNRENDREREKEETIEGLMMTYKILQEDNTALKQQLRQTAKDNKL